MSIKCNSQANDTSITVSEVALRSLEPGMTVLQGRLTPQPLMR